MESGSTAHLPCCDQRVAHRTCTLRWLMQTETCMLCRTPLSLSSMCLTQCERWDILRARLRQIRYLQRVARRLRDVYSILRGFEAESERSGSSDDDD